MGLADANPKYWLEYSNLQKVKHDVIENYLNGWFPKLTLGSTGCRRILYIDTHAGRGTHLSGELGSPLVAVNTLLKHRSKDLILENTLVDFFLIERDAENAKALEVELSRLTLPSKVTVNLASDDCFETIDQTLTKLETSGSQMAPSFIFVDPYGFKLPGRLLQRLLAHRGVELFINVIWRELDMAIQQVLGNSDVEPDSEPERPTNRPLFSLDDEDDDPARQNSREGTKRSLENTLNSVFDGDGWRNITAEKADDRADLCADLFRKVTGATYGTHLRMLDNGRIRYFLLHLTNHPSGRELMKDCIWKSCPDGGFSASKSNNPRQRILIETEPDLRGLEDWVRARLLQGPRRWKQLEIDLLPELWRTTHLGGVLRDLCKRGIVIADGKAVATRNPLLRLAGI